MLEKKYTLYGYKHDKLQYTTKWDDVETTQVKKEYIGGIYAWLQLCKLKHVRSDQRVAEKWE